jgi:hypothetical protein
MVQYFPETTSLFYNHFRIEGNESDLPKMNEQINHPGHFGTIRGD